MFATDLRKTVRRRERGASLIASFALVLVVGAFSISMTSASMTRYSATRARVGSSRAFYVAEGGLDLCASQIARDALWPVKNTTEFPTVDADGYFVSRTIPFGSDSGTFSVRIAYEKVNDVPSDWTGAGFPAGFVPSERLRFASRTPTAAPAFDRMVVEVTGRSGGEERVVRGDLRREFNAFGAAIVGDAISLAGSGSGKSWAISNQTLVMNGENQFVYGGIQVNGGAYLGGSSTPITDDNVATLLPGFEGAVKTKLAGTPDEIPDYTAPGSSTQLFDFGRFKAAARAGRGAVYSGLAAFATAMNTANAAGKPLEGVIYVEIDCAAEGSGPKINHSSASVCSGNYGIRDGINIKGTLVFSFVNAPDSFYKVFIETPLRINAADLPADYSPTDPSTWRTAYPPTFSSGKDPRGADLSSYGYASFAESDDLPALMFDTGTVDIHDEANICGAVYGPSFIEIENNRSQRQYFNGIVIGGAGIYLKGTSSATAPQHFVYDRGAINALATFDGAGTSPTVTRLSVGR